MVTVIAVFRINLYTDAEKRSGYVDKCFGKYTVIMMMILIIIIVSMNKKIAFKINE